MIKKGTYYGVDLIQLWELREKFTLASVSASSSEPEVIIDQRDW